MEWGYLPMALEKRRMREDMAAHEGTWTGTKLDSRMRSWSVCLSGWGGEQEQARMNGVLETV